MEIPFLIQCVLYAPLLIFITLLFFDHVIFTSCKQDVCTPLLVQTAIISLPTLYFFLHPTMFSFDLYLMSLTSCYLLVWAIDKAFERYYAIGHESVVDEGLDLNEVMLDKIDDLMTNDVSLPSLIMVLGLVYTLAILWWCPSWFTLSLHLITIMACFATLHYYYLPLLTTHEYDHEEEEEEEGEERWDKFMLELMSDIMTIFGPGMPLVMMFVSVYLSLVLLCVSATWLNLWVHMANIVACFAIVHQYYLPVLSYYNYHVYFDELDDEDEEESDCYHEDDEEYHDHNIEEEEEETTCSEEEEEEEACSTDEEEEEATCSEEEEEAINDDEEEEEEGGGGGGGRMDGDEKEPEKEDNFEVIDHQVWLCED